MEASREARTASGQVAAGREFVRPEVDNGRIVERPLDGVPRPRHDLRHGGLVLLRDRRLAARQRKASSRVVGHDVPLEDREEGPVQLHVDEELGSSHPGDGEGRLHLQTAGATAEEVGRALKEPDHRRPLLLHGFDRDPGRTGVEPEHRLVEEGDVGPAALLGTEWCRRDRRCRSA